jgi:hypothetical protein
MASNGRLNVLAICNKAAAEIMNSLDIDIEGHTPESNSTALTLKIYR